MKRGPAAPGSASLQQQEWLIGHNANLNYTFSAIMRAERGDAIRIQGWMITWEVHASQKGPTLLDVLKSAVARGVEVNVIIGEFGGSLSVPVRQALKRFLLHAVAQGYGTFKQPYPFYYCGQLNSVCQAHLGRPCCLDHRFVNRAPGLVRFVHTKSTSFYHRGRWSCAVHSGDLKAKNNLDPDGVFFDPIADVGVGMHGPVCEKVDRHFVGLWNSYRSTSAIGNAAIARRYDVREPTPGDSFVVETKPIEVATVDGNGQWFSYAGPRIMIGGGILENATTETHPRPTAHPRSTAQLIETVPVDEWTALGSHRVSELRPTNATYVWSHYERLYDVRLCLGTRRALLLLLNRAACMWPLPLPRHADPGPPLPFLRRLRGMRSQSTTSSSTMSLSSRHSSVHAVATSASNCSPIHTRARRPGASTLAASAPSAVRTLHTRNLRTTRAPA